MDGANDPGSAERDAEADDGRPTPIDGMPTPMTGTGSPLALVTGGGTRVGRAIAHGLAESGYDLVVSYNRSGKGAEELALSARRRGRRALAVQADLLHEPGAIRLAAAVRDRFGTLDLLVNSASSFVSNDLLQVTAEEWDAVMAVNLRAPFLLLRETADLLRAARGSVVNIVDLSALRPWTSHPHHSVSKAALLHLTKVMALRLAPEARANAVAPGDVLPPESWTREQVTAARRSVPLNRIGTPEDVVAAVRFLARAGYVTGAVIAVDGGLGLS